MSSYYCKPFAEGKYATLEEKLCNYNEAGTRPNGSIDSSMLSIYYY